MSLSPAFHRHGADIAGAAGRAEKQFGIVPKITAGIVPAVTLRKAPFKPTARGPFRPVSAPGPVERPVARLAGGVLPRGRRPRLSPRPQSRRIDVARDRGPTAAPLVKAFVPSGATVIGSTPSSFAERRRWGTDTIGRGRRLMGPSSVGATGFGGSHD